MRIFKSAARADGDEKTEFVDDASVAGSHYTVRLSRSGDSGKTWMLTVTGDLLIGRAEHCAVRLDDKSVSREQCKIVIGGNGPAIVHLGSTNKTTLNGGIVNGSSPLQSGDTIKAGRESLHIDYIEVHGTNPPESESEPEPAPESEPAPAPEPEPTPPTPPPQNSGSDNTEIIFN